MTPIIPAEGKPATPAELEIQIEICKLTNSLSHRGFDRLTIAQELRVAALGLTLAEVVLNAPGKTQ